MPTILDHLITKLSLDGVGFQRGLQQAGKSADSFGQKITSGLKGQIAGAFAVGSVLAFARATFNAAGNIKDMADRLQINTDRLQEFEAAAQNSGIKFTAVEQAITHLFAGIEEGSKDAASGLKRLGLNVDDIQEMKFDDALGLIQQKLLDVEDASRRASIELELFGKKGGLKFGQILAEPPSGRTKFTPETLENIDVIETAIGNVNRSIGAGLANMFVDPIGTMFGKSKPAGMPPSPFGQFAGQGMAGFDPGPLPEREKTYGQLKEESREWMKLQDMILEVERIEALTSKERESATMKGLTAEERRKSLVEKRRNLEAVAEGRFTLNEDPIRQAKAKLEIAKIDGELAGIKRKKDGDITITSANELAQIGGRASVAGTGQASVVSELRKLNDALTRRGVKLARF